MNRRKPNQKNTGNVSPWEKFIKELENDKRKFKQDNNSYYDLLKDSYLDKGENLTIYVASEDLVKKVNKKRQKIQNKLFKLNPHWNNKKLFIKFGQPPAKSQSSKVKRISSPSNKAKSSPLQALNRELINDDNQKNKILQAAVTAEKQCRELYKQLSQRTEDIATQAFSLDVEFNWRLRVGGMRGFQELLLPVFHPVYGIPYVPASSLKGAVRAWARKHYLKSEINRLLGNLDEGIGCVQILDAFPKAPCLSVDIANPQWHWQGTEQVKYKSEPHFVLSMYKPKMKIGLMTTSRGADKDVSVVKDWLKKALATGIGSRVSSGYGRIEKSYEEHSNLALPSSSHKFKLWTQGMYGASDIEFRPTALRGMLRYWFRAVALSIYSHSDCKNLESELFGTIEPQAQEGKIALCVDWIERKGDRSRPYYYEGNILLEAKEPIYLDLGEKLLQLASHLGGIGRGSRRPLHWNNPYPGLRGCYWELENNKLPADEKIWKQLFSGLKNAFSSIKSPSRNTDDCSPGIPGHRKQDVLNQNSKIYLVKDTSVVHPAKINSWQQEGIKSKVRGSALDLLYQNEFKGINRNREGNNQVGGAFGTPSYVVIKSNFPQSAQPYQAVTVFGSNQRDRAVFCREIEKIGGIEIEW